jgi:hypothetical protein
MDKALSQRQVPFRAVVFFATPNKNAPGRKTGPDAALGSI